MAEHNLIDIIKNEKTIALLAPSFPIDFKFPDIIRDLRKIGFDKVVELTYAAKLINQKYRELIKENPQKQYICTNCPTVTQYILNNYPQHKDKLVNIASPMVIMSRFVKQEFGKTYKTIFIGPCFAKKMEAKESGDVDYVLTFKELQDVFDYYKTNNLKYVKYNKKIVTESGEPDFDSFYNDYTKIYPITGAVAKTMHYKGIMTKDQIIMEDGIQNIDNAIEKMEANTDLVFLDLLTCAGGCIGGAGIISKQPKQIKEKLIFDYKHHCKKNKIDSKLGKIKDCKNIKFQNNLIGKTNY